MAEKILQREEIAAQDKWAIEDLYATDEAWYEDLALLKQEIIKIPAYRGRLGQSASTLYEYMLLDEKIGLLLENLANYAQRKCDEDTRVAAYQAMVGQITSVWVETAASSSFETPELLAIADKTLEQFYQAEPKLTLYKRKFENLRRRREHILSDAEEKILAAAGEMAQAPDNIFSMFSRLIMPMSSLNSTPALFTSTSI